MSEIESLVELQEELNALRTLRAVSLLEVERALRPAPRRRWVRVRRAYHWWAHGPRTAVAVLIAPWLEDE